MIQRIQTVFLLLATLSAGLLFVFPIAWYYGEFNTIEFMVYQLIDTVPGSQPVYNSFFLLPLIAITLISMGLSVAVIFSYKSMNKQLRMTKLNIFLTIVLIAAIFFFYADHIGKTLNALPQYEFGIFLPLIVLVFLILALRAIQRDLKLVRSVDRLR
ncbi:MAG: DUF4293 domain-containing protein [Bacteroidetes bacterium]|nr:DUF4293 domain-containing protein [Bacteroidota bacterium]